MLKYYQPPPLQVISCWERTSCFSVLWIFRSFSSFFFFFTNFSQWLSFNSIELKAWWLHKLHLKEWVKGPHFRIGNGKAEGGGEVERADGSSSIICQDGIYSCLLWWNKLLMDNMFPSSNPATARSLFLIK